MWYPGSWVRYLIVSFPDLCLVFFTLEWDSSPFMKQLNDIHYEAARIITGGTELCSHDKLHSDLGLDSLQVRRTENKLVTFYKIVSNLIPPYLEDFVPLANMYRIRNSNDIRTIHTSTNFYQSTIRDWNNYPKK